jgi:16S rRNA (guanine966-N2)-methyltransferase
VREAAFGMLGTVEGSNVLDLFAGSGALGIEALSRGAASATFVDSEPRATTAIEANIERLGIEDDAAKVFRADAISFLRGAARHGDRWDLAFCDPPYRLAARLAGELGALLAPVLNPGARVLCESSHRQPLRLELAQPVVAVERRYGDTLIVIHSKTDLHGT